MMLCLQQHVDQSVDASPVDARLRNSNLQSDSPSNLTSVEKPAVLDEDQASSTTAKREVEVLPPSSRPCRLPWERQERFPRHARSLVCRHSRLSSKKSTMSRSKRPSRGGEVQVWIPQGGDARRTGVVMEHERCAEQPQGGVRE